MKKWNTGHVPNLCSPSTIKQKTTLDFKKKMFAVEQISDKDPKCGSPQASEQWLPVTVLIAHFPAKRKVKAQQRMAHIYQDGVHA